MTPLNSTSGVTTGHRDGAIPQPRHAAILAALEQIQVDQFDELLNASGSDIAKLMQTLDHPATLDTSVKLAELFRSAVAAVAEGDVSRALTQLAEFASLDPRRGELLPSDSALASIRTEVTQLLAKLTFAAKSNADERLDQARQVLATIPQDGTAAGAIKPEVALFAASQLMAAGGYANFIHAGELAQVVIDYRRWIPTAIDSPSKGGGWTQLPVPALLWTVFAMIVLLLLVWSMAR